MVAESVLAAWEECDPVDTAFILICTVLCWTIVPTVSLHHEASVDGFVIGAPQ